MFVKRRERKDENFERTTVSPVMPIVENGNQDDSKKRGPDDIKAEILIKGLSSTSKTETMNSCNLSTSQFKKYLERLSRNGLMKIEQKDRKNVCTTTPRGKRWLEQFRILREIENGADVSKITYIA